MIGAKYLTVFLLVLTACSVNKSSRTGNVTAGAVPGEASAGGVWFGNWPAGASPSEIGRRVAQNYLARPLGTAALHYAEACTWYGCLTAARLMSAQDLDTQLVSRFDPILTPAGASLIPPRAHVDDRVFGIVPLEIDIHNGDSRYLAIGKDLADKQWLTTTPDGIATEARYWVDDMYMITSLQVQAFRATGHAEYLDRAALTMAAYLDRLQQPNGLFFHTANSPQFWGRGNGWVAAGMTELLRALPATHARRPRILDGYQKMMVALLQYQTTAGLWRQLLDNPQAWPETSGSAMFTFALVSGVKNGWVDGSLFGPAARTAWLGLITYLDAEANLREVCIGTGEAFTVVGTDRAAQVQYYLDRPRIVGDFHGQAPVMWSASALLR
jgi:rhamnogalacturonyl hydrolase YesR